MNTLYHGDCLEIMPTLPAGSVDLIFADLPFGVTDCEWDSVIPLDLLWAEYKRLIKPNGAIVLFATMPFAADLCVSNKQWFRYDIVWRKTTPVGVFNAKKMPLRTHELLLVFYKKLPTYNPQMWNFINPRNKIGQGINFNKADRLEGSVYGKAKEKTVWIENGKRYPLSVIEFDNRNISGHSSGDPKPAYHPTQKPVDLCEYVIRTFTNPGELVLDNTMGSGSAIVAAEQTGRNSIGIEKEKKFYKIAVKRVAGAHPPLFTETATPANTACTRQGEGSRQNSLFSTDGDSASGEGVKPAPCG